MTTAINLAIEFTSMGWETTEQEAALYIAELQSKIEAEYPDANVNVSLDVSGPGSFEVSADDWETQDEIINRVLDIKRAVGENGDWHNAE